MRIYEIYDQPPIVRSLGSPAQDESGRLLYAFDVSHPALTGNHMVTIQYWPDYRSGVVNAWGSLEHINRLGPGAIRHVIGRLKAEIPNLDSLKGVRETGARAGHKNVRDRFQSLDVSRIAPITEENLGNSAGEVFDPCDSQTYPQPRDVRVPHNNRTRRNPAVSPTSGVIMRKDPMIQAPLDPMFENMRPTWNLPPAPGTAPIPTGHVRLYHQTNPELLGAIKHQGIDLNRARGIEGPRAIYADEKGFYGKPGDVPTVEFHVPAEQWDRPFVRSDLVPPENILGVHRAWHNTARYIEEDPKIIQRILSGGHDNLLGDPQYGKAIRYIKHKYSMK